MSTPSRHLSLWLPRLSTDRLASSLGRRDDAPLVVATMVQSALRLAGLNAAAERLGLKRGMPLADARAMHPTIGVADADTEADRRLLEKIADWCDRYTPLVALDQPDGLILDVTGCTHLFGGEAALASDLVRRLSARNLYARAAIADTVGCAFAVARHGLPASGVHPTCVREGRTREALLPLPLAALRLSPDVVDGLARVGLKRIGDVLEHPRAPLAARFGQAFLVRLDQALGRLDEPITPRLPPPCFMTERRFAEPIALESDVMGTIARLAAELADILERHGEGARRISAALFRTDGEVHRVTVGTASPLRDPGRMARLFNEKFAALGDECDPGFGYDMVRLAALSTQRLDPAQASLMAQAHGADISHLIDVLGARFGRDSVSRLVLQDTHIPEFAVAAMPAHRGRGGAAAMALASGRPGYETLIQDSLAPVRPIRLFARPEPIDVTMAEVPDGPPQGFRWRRVLHQVAHVEGPERILMEWWRDDAGQALARDYFRIESKEGLRVWLYRQSVASAETPHPRWFIHGLFA